MQFVSPIDAEVTVDPSRLPEPFRSRAEERSALPSIEKVRHFLHGYVADATNSEEIRDDIRLMCATRHPDLATDNARSIRLYPQRLVHRACRSRTW
ncbi:hypothetical protein KZ829_36915 [Actinoplanes hulinensis]|uniref:Uncharacterized protein n=1 Tax=Actinoplanes hulinensis TaxID=1144547 RepID=A0ABS7BEN5_9ACTN|nr:hypothetical protein [Actinoplanes hulinensis]MBW6439320.1 hypothetical protein [Actinoplanes hulinensis]